MAERKYRALVLGELEENTAEFRLRLLENRYSVEIIEVQGFENFQTASQDPQLDIIIADIAPYGLDVVDGMMAKPPMRPTILIGDAEQVSLLVEAKRRGMQFIITRTNDRQSNLAMLFLEIIRAIEQIAEPPSMKYMTLVTLNRYTQYYNVEQPFFVIDRNIRLLYFNCAAFDLIEQLHGMKIQLGDDVEDFFFESSRDAFNKHIEQAFAGHALNVDYSSPILAQALSHRELRYRPVFTESQDVIAVSITSVDISARLMAEQRFLDREAALWDVFDVGPLPLVVVDEDLIVTRANPAFRKLLNLGEGDTLEGQSGDVFLFPEYRNALRRKLAKLFEGQFLYFQNEQRYCKADGMAVWVYHMGFEISLGQQGQRGVLIMALDITRRKEAEQRNHHAARINAIGELASSIAHDFNSILTVMSMLNEMLEENLDTFNETEMKDHVQKMSQAILKGTTLTRQLLDFEPDRDVELEIVDLNDYLRDCHELFKSALGDNIELNIEFAVDSLPIQLGKGEIDQIVMNFVVNARDAMPDGGTLHIDTSRLWIYSERDAPRGGLTPGDWVVCRFVDTGVGMSSETQQRLFEPFYTTKSSEKGTGLGMATVYRILERMKGKVYVDSVPGEGTTFTLYIPVGGVSA